MRFACTITYDGAGGREAELDEPQALRANPQSTAPITTVRFMVTGYHVFSVHAQERASEFDPEACSWCDWTT